VEQEEWRDVAGTDGTMQVSSEGRVRSRRARNGHELPDGEWRLCDLSLQGKGYLTLQVMYPDGKHNRLVHDLVLEAFVGPRPDGHQGRHHPDPTRTNNALTNLSWGTQSDNMQDAVLDGNIARQKLNAEQARAIRNVVDTGPLTQQVLLDLQHQWPGVSHQTFKSIKSRRTWKVLDRPQQ